MLTQTAYVAVRKSHTAPGGEFFDLGAASGDRDAAAESARRYGHEHGQVMRHLPVLRIARVRVTEEPAEAAAAPADTDPLLVWRIDPRDLFNCIDAPAHDLLQAPLANDTAATALLRHIRDIAAAIADERIPAHAIDWRTVRDLAGEFLANETGDG